MTTQNERPIDDATRDTRSASEKFGLWLFQPKNFRVALCSIVVGGSLLPAVWPLWTIVLLILWIAVADMKVPLPLRQPADLGGTDPSDFDVVEKEVKGVFGMSSRTVKTNHYRRSAGTFYFGKERSKNPLLDGLEVWGSIDDTTTHGSLAGRTGAGKSRVLVALAYNALLLGAGVIYGDGKAMADFTYELWCMARSRGREDSVLVLSFLTGSVDPIERLVKRPGSRAETRHIPQTNSFQPWAEGEPSYLLQLTTSLLGKATGEGQRWQEKAINLADAVFRILVFKRANGEGDTSVQSVRDALSLEYLAKCYLEGIENRLPELVFLPIKAYLETGLPGFVPSDAAHPEKWDKEVRNQHGYLTGQFARMLSMLTDSYGHIFNDRFAEIDLYDVLVNNRILVITIPSMQRSASESSALGSLYLSALRFAMARNLGYQLEGTHHEIVEVRATNTTYPTVVISDELSFWLASGIAIMFAQARALKMFMIAAFQDVQGLKRSEAADEVASMIANTSFKYTLALEDPDDTFELFRKAAGQAAFDVMTGFDAAAGVFSTSWTSQTSTRIEIRDRLKISELKSLRRGDGVLIFNEKVIRVRSMYISSQDLSSRTVPMRINRFLQVPPPSYLDIPESVDEAMKKAEGKHLAKREVAGALYRGIRPFYPYLIDPIADAVRDAAAHINALPKQQFTANERAILMYQAAYRKLIELRSDGAEGDLHEAIPTSASDEDYPELSL